MDKQTKVKSGIPEFEPAFKIIDWNWLAHHIVEYDLRDLHAGLKEDWNCTAGQILCDGKPVMDPDTYVFLGSTWATAVLRGDSDCEIPMLPTNDVSWHASALWPNSALTILNASRWDIEAGFTERMAGGY